MKFFRTTPAILRRFAHYVQRPVVSRSLLSDATLSLDDFLRNRILHRDVLGVDGKENLTEELSKLSTVSDARKFRKDIVVFTHSADRHDLPLVTKLMKMLGLSFYSSHPEALAEGHHNFGAATLRLHHYLGLPQEAHELYHHPECSPLFTDIVCHKVLMDLLYKHEMFTEVTDVFTNLQDVSQDCLTLVLGALYNLNTPHSMEMTEIYVSQHPSLPLRGLLFAAQLFLKQNKPDRAVELLDSYSGRDLLKTNTQIMCFAKQGDLDSMFMELFNLKRMSDNQSKPFSARLYSDTMDEVCEAVREYGQKKDIEKLRTLERQLFFNGVLSQQTTEALINRVLPGRKYYIKRHARTSNMIG